MAIPKRFWIACMVFMTTFTNYSFRVNIAISMVSMTKGKTKEVPYCLQGEWNNTHNSSNPPGLPDYGPRYDWDERIQGTLLGAYFYGYMMTSVISGLVSEYFGPFKTILSINVMAAIVNTLSVYAATWHWSALFVCRLILGMGGAIIYPALQVLIAYWAPPKEKGKFTGALMGNVLGTSMIWPIVGIVTATLGWDWGFFVVSIEIILFCIAFGFLVTDEPETHRWITLEEIGYIQESQAGNVNKKKRIAPLKDIFTNGPYWMLVICHIGNEWGLAIQLSLVPKFISEVIGFDLCEAGGLSALPPMLRLLFGLILGSIADELLKRQVLQKAAIRKTYTVLSHVFPGLMLIGLTFVGCNWIPAIILLTFSMGFNGACVQNVLIIPHDLAPNFSATIYGLNSFFGGLIGFMIPALNGEFIRNHSGITEWSYTFIIGGIAYCSTGIIWVLFGSVEEQKFNRK